MKERAGRKGYLIPALLLVCLLAAACAPGVNELVRTPNAMGVVAGFWRGVWHGAIAPITFVISLFNPHVQVYEVHNNGAWYNLGFLIGLTLPLGGGAAGRGRGRRRRRAQR